MSKEFFCSTIAHNGKDGDGDHTWILRGLGSMPRITRVEQGVDREVMDNSEPITRVYHTGPDWALCVVAGMGFVHEDDRPDACPHCKAPVSKEDLFPVWCSKCEQDIYTPTRQWNE